MSDPKISTGESLSARPRDAPDDVDLSQRTPDSDRSIECALADDLAHALQHDDDSSTRS